MERLEVEVSCRLFLMQTNLPFLLKVRHLLVTLGLAEAFRPCYEYFESSEKEHSSQSFRLGCLPLSCPACVPYVKWVFLGGKCVCFPVHISLYAHGGDRGQEMSIYNQWVQLSRLLLPAVGFFLSLLCLKLEVTL